MSFSSELRVCLSACAVLALAACMALSRDILTRAHAAGALVDKRSAASKEQQDAARAVLVEALIS